MPNFSKEFGKKETYYTPQEVAERMKVVRKTVYRWLESGELHAIRFERQYRISDADIEDFVRRHWTGGEG